MAVFVLVKASGKQYIATMNEYQLTSLKDVIAVEEYEEIYSTVRLELKDDSPESKLLGVQIDMRYEKD